MSLSSPAHDCFGMTDPTAEEIAALRPCPFCAMHVGELFFNRYIDGTSGIVCCNCSAIGPRLMGADHKMLIEAWNGKRKGLSAWANM